MPPVADPTHDRGFGPPSGPGDHSKSSEPLTPILAISVLLAVILAIYYLHRKSKSRKQQLRQIEKEMELKTFSRMAEQSSMAYPRGGSSPFV